MKTKQPFKVGDVVMIVLTGVPKWNGKLTTFIKQEGNLVLVKYRSARNVEDILELELSEIRKLSKLEKALN